MIAMMIIFWLLTACVIYTYVGYPLLLAALAKFRRRHVRRGAAPPPRSVSVIIAGYNEELNIRRRVREFLTALDRNALDAELIVVSDGSTDGTARAAREEMSTYAGSVQTLVIELPTNAGKAAALSQGAAAATREILVFADARQTWCPDAVDILLENFADKTVGAAGGDLVLQSDAGVMAGVGLYWRYEKSIRRMESRFGSVVGLSGSICAVRRQLFPVIPQGTILDDVYWPLFVAMRGYRVVHDERAQAFDRLPSRARDEFRRKVRTLSGNFQLASRLPASLLPWRNPVWTQFISHKLLRLAVPWALLGMLALSAAIGGPLYWTLFAAQVACHLLGIAGMVNAIGSRLRIAGGAASFLMLNAAAWIAFWVWAMGYSSRSWNKVAYQKQPAAAAANDSDAYEHAGAR